MSTETKGYRVTRSEAEWRALLTPEQYAVMRGHGTERPGAGCVLVHIHEVESHRPRNPRSGPKKDPESFLSQEVEGDSPGRCEGPGAIHSIEPVSFALAALNWRKAGMKARILGICVEKPILPLPLPAPPEGRLVPD